MYKLEDGVTQSILNKFLQCQRCAELHLSGVRMAVPSRALTIGTIVHSAIAVLRQQGSNAALKEVSRQVNKMQAKASSPEDFEAAEMNGSIIEALVRNYAEVWGTADSESKFTGVEVVIDTMFRHLRLRGKVDALVQTKGGLFIVETKTHSQIPKNVDDSLVLNFQILFYLVCMELTLGTIPQGIIYDMIRVPQLRRGKKESNPEFLQRVITDIREKQNSEGHYFHRFEITISPEMYQQFKWDLIQIVDNYRRWWKDESKVIAMRSYRCITRGVCEYMSLCATGNMGLYSNNNSPFAELESDTDET